MARRAGDRPGGGCAEPAAMLNRGFTLVELVVVLAVAALLLSLAMPAYREQSLRAARSEALRALAAAAGCLERHRAQTGRYAGYSCAGGPGTRYTITVSLGGTPGDERYRVVATPVGAQQSDACGMLGLDHLGRRTASGAMPIEDCWAGR